MTLLHREIQAEPRGKKLSDLFALFHQSGGFALCRQTPSAKAILRRLLRAYLDLRYVFEIVDYLCRFKLHEETVRKHFACLGRTYTEAYFTIESAKDFVERSANHGYGKSKISKIWDKYKNSAPYIYAFFEVMSHRTEPTPDEAVDYLIKSTAEPDQLTNLLAKAGFAADILQGMARNVRTRDFEGVRRARPESRVFTTEELELIVGTDRQQPIA